MSLTLIQLVSEQTLQNLLPALALRPGQIIQVKSSDPRFKQTPRHFVDACKVAGLDATDFPLADTIPHDSPDIQETMQCLEAIIARHDKADLALNLHWSVEPEQRGDDYGETDLIAVDRQKLNLAVISCKTSTEHVSTLEHLSSWRDRARTLGGSHASGHLCLFRAKSPAQASDLCAMGKKMNIQVHIAEDIPACFAEPCSGAL